MSESQSLNIILTFTLSELKSLLVGALLADKADPDGDGGLTRQVKIFTLVMAELLTNLPSNRENIEGANLIANDMLANLEAQLRREGETAEPGVFDVRAACREAIRQWSNGGGLS